MESEPCTVLYDQQIHTVRTVPANKPGIIVRHNAERWRKLIVLMDITPDNYRSGQKVVVQKFGNRSGQDVGSKDRNYSNHRGSRTENHATHSIKGNLKKILKNLKEEETIQEIALCGTAHILRENIINSTNKIRAFIPKESSGRNLE